MPGSLNYSPSGSEGGKSLGGGGADLIGVDLVATPGTTPLKWRGRTSGGSNGGTHVQEEASGCTTAGKTIDKPPDRVPPKIATRKPSLEVASTAAASLEEPVGLSRKRSAPTNVISRESEFAVPPNDPSRTTTIPSSALSTPRRPSLSTSSNPSKAADCARGIKGGEYRDVSADENGEVALRPSAGYVVGDGQNRDEDDHGGCRSALSVPSKASPENENMTRVGSLSGGQSGPPFGTMVEGLRAHDDVTPAASAPIDDVHLSTVPLIRGGAFSDDGNDAPQIGPQSVRRVSPAAVEIAAALAGRAEASRGKDTPLGEDDSRERQKNNSSTDDEGENAGGQPKAVPPVVRKAASISLRAVPLEGEAHVSEDINDEETHEAGRQRVGLSSMIPGSGGRSDSDGDRDGCSAERRPSVSQSGPKSSTGSEGSSNTPRSMAVSPTPAVPNQPDGVEQASTNAVAMDTENVPGATTDLNSWQHQNNHGVEGRDLQERQHRTNSEQSENGSAADNLTTAGADAKVDHPRRSSGRRNGADDADNPVRCVNVAEDRGSQHPVVTAGESGTVDGVRTTQITPTPRNRNLLQSPPTITRRNSGGRRTDPVPGADKTARNLVAKKEQEEGAVAPSGAVERVPPGYRGIREQWSTPHGPPPLTPRRDRSVVPAATLVSSNPRSPVAMAARVISLEESARSTLRMKRAAEAIALEDAQTCIRAERRNEQRKEPLGHPATPTSLPAEPEEESGIDQDAKDEEETRARHAEKMRVRALRDIAARHEAEIERDRALELTLEVLRRKKADKRRGVSRAHSAPGRKRVHSPSRRSTRPADHRTSLARKIKDSAARSCGLSPAQVLLLRRSREFGRKGDRPRSACVRRRDKLAEPKENRPATRIRNPATEALLEELTKSMTDKERRAFVHACLEDAKECTHRPHTRAAQRAGGVRANDGRGGEEEAKDGAGAAGTRDAFLYRVDAQERAKAAAMEHRRGELAYKAVLDKRVCSGCGAEQSYDEVQEKRKTCPNCEVEYRKPRTWATVRKDFLNRVEAFQQSKWESLQAAADRTERQQTRTLVLGRSSRYDAADTDSEGEEQERLFWEDIEDDFVSRLQEDAARRQASLASRSAALHEDWTFQPSLSAASERVMGDSAWAGMSFLERVEDDLQRRRETANNAAHGNLEDGNGFSFGCSHASHT